MWVGEDLSILIVSLYVLTKKKKQGLCTWMPTCSHDCSGATPNNATRGSGSTLCSRSSKKVQNIDRQKHSNLGHDQNMWSNDPSSHLHLLHTGLKPGNIWASLTLDKWALCTTLNCISEWRAHIDDEWTCLRILFHVSSESSLSRSSSQALLMIFNEEEDNWSLNYK